MRLLNSSTLELEDFNADSIPPYAILSHTWGEDEVSFADMERGNARNKAGYQKIKYACEQAADDAQGYIWVDTCCIDQRSSAELSEAINSMYTWYQNAVICYAYLADVSKNKFQKFLAADWSMFANSRWFKRGWTLQELIAPANMVFYSKEWNEVGTKSDLQKALAEITGIDLGILIGTMDLESTSVAKRMSWASHRTTTRREDIAYCLMGLFNVNMPMLYGEGSKAFLRLQEEIMKHSDDHSLFAWTSATPTQPYHGLLATSPTDFARSGTIKPYHDSKISKPFSMTNKGLCIDLPLNSDNKYLIALLDCIVLDYQGPLPKKRRLGIYLKRVSRDSDQYTRVEPQTLCECPPHGRMATLYVRQLGSNSGPKTIIPLHISQLQNGPAHKHGYELVGVCLALNSVSLPMQYSQMDLSMLYNMPLMFKISAETGKLAGALLFEFDGYERFAIMFGSGEDLEVGFDVALSSSNIDIESIPELEGSFLPKAPGLSIFLENHEVLVNSELRVFSGNKYYLLDVLIRNIRRAAGRPINMISQKIPKLDVLPIEFSQGTIAIRSCGFQRKKSFESLFEGFEGLAVSK